MRAAFVAPVRRFPRSWRNNTFSLSFVLSHTHTLSLFLSYFFVFSETIRDTPEDRRAALPRKIRSDYACISVERIFYFLNYVDRITAFDYICRAKRFVFFFFFLLLRRERVCLCLDRNWIRARIGTAFSYRLGGIGMYTGGIHAMLL